MHLQQPAEQHPSHVLTEVTLEREVINRVLGWVSRGENVSLDVSTIGFFLRGRGERGFDECGQRYIWGPVLVEDRLKVLILTDMVLFAKFHSK